MTSPMKFLLALCAVLIGFSAAAHSPAPPPAVAAKSWLLLDVGSQQILASSGMDERIEPASLTKLMSAYLTFSALKQKRIHLTQQVNVSERAWRTGGSRMFIEPNKPVSVDELLHGMIIQSGNDATVALAELIAGSEDNFVALMNREAERLGLKNTRFTNATGLTETGHYSSARDLASLAVALIRDFPEYYPIYSKKEFTFNKIAQVNRNRLLWLDPSVDGLKTGHTELAGYCLIATSKRGPRRLLSVVLGTDSDNSRAMESQKLLNWGFLFFETVKIYSAQQAVSELRIWRGASNSLKAGFSDDLVLSLPKGSAEKIKVSMVSKQPLMAPVRRGDVVGSLRVMIDDKPIGEYPLLALSDVPVAGVFGRTWDALRLWLQ
jgi:D-alanyl-D-alanine carboxypeptidase (penicillin-binding protein 5/6)